MSEVIPGDRLLAPVVFCVFFTGEGYEYFGNFGKALFTMFQVLTGESWSEAIGMGCASCDMTKEWLLLLNS